MKTIIETKRELLGLKVFELANHVKIDASLMSRILNGKREPSDEQLLQLSQLLALDYEELLKEKMIRKVTSVLKDYPEIAEEVLTVAEKRISYLLGENKLEVIDISSIQAELKVLTELQARWKKKKPLSSLQLKKMLEYFHTQYTYESNQIEGNTLDFQETHLVVNEGITIGGKSMREHLEAINHQEAIGFIGELATQKGAFNQQVLLQIHQLILKGIQPRNAGKYRSVQVRISGSKHIPPEPYLIEDMMQDYFLFYAHRKKKLHPVVLAAEMHERLVSIHPFIDGNGRTARLVMNLILLQHGYPIVSLKGDLANRLRYYKALEAVQVEHDRTDFYQLIAERTKHTLLEYLAMVK
ncbi:MAG TPA: Fic family protein [Chitinophagales bacterium]|nr:Fic family protein [Chitinophagales bacterium]